MSKQYTFLLTLLQRAKVELETARDVSRELSRDGMLIGECRNIQATIDDVERMREMVTQRSTGALARSKGQVAYEADVAVRPTYHDGTPRRTWDQLPPWAQGDWARV